MTVQGCAFIQWCNEVLCGGIMGGGTQSGEGERGKQGQHKRVKGREEGLVHETTTRNCASRAATRLVTALRSKGRTSVTGTLASSF